jgi:hypothetical protein
MQMSFIEAQGQWLRADSGLLQPSIFRSIKNGDPSRLDDLDRHGVCKKGGNPSNLVFYKLLRYAIPNLLNST